VRGRKSHQHPSEPDKRAPAVTSSWSGVLVGGEAAAAGAVEAVAEVAAGAAVATGGEVVEIVETVDGIGLAANEDTHLQAA